MKIQAAVVHQTGAPFVIEECELQEPAAREVRVKVQACGICHTDITTKDFPMGTPMPAVLGHEGVGIIEAIGPEVDGFAVGDKVLMSFGSCGQCSKCRGGAPNYCHHVINYCLMGKRLDGSSPLQLQGASITGHFFAQSSFATHAVASINNMVKLDADLPAELMAPLACGVQTGMGSVMIAMEAKEGESIAVFGCGTVGLAAIAAAKIAGCKNIYAIDIQDERLLLAQELGATQVINSTKENPLKLILKQGGVHYSFDATGVGEVIETAFNVLKAQGTLVCAGVGKPGTKAAVDLSMLVTTGRRIRGTVEGDAVPRDFIPKMVQWYREGRLPLEKLVTTYPFEKINEAVADMKAARCVKAVLQMN